MLDAGALGQRRAIAEIPAHIGAGSTGESGAQGESVRRQREFRQRSRDRYRSGRDLDLDRIAAPPAPELGPVCSHRQENREIAQLVR